MCTNCNDTGYVQRQKEATLPGGIPYFYEVLVECPCNVKKVEIPMATTSKVIKKRRNSHEWWND